MKIKNILEKFSNINLKATSFLLKQTKETTMRFLKNLKWIDYLSLIKTKSKELISLVPANKIDNSAMLSSKDIRQYLNYISSGGNYKERVNTDKQYLSLYDYIPTANDPVSNFDVSNFLRSFEKF